MLRGRQIRRASAALWCFGISQAALGGAVVTDGTLGSAGAITPPNGVYSIPATLGTTRGTNLFHSFSQLNLDAGQTASFSGPTNIQNVLTRVTGGASNINGTIQCTIPNANFYLINPAGVVFGPSAALDVKGSFAVTTADLIRHADGGVFHASNPSASVLSTAPPSAFGFLGPRPAITVNTATLQVPDGKSIAAVGGDVQLSTATMQSTGGHVIVASAASAGDVHFDATTLNVTGYSTPILGNVTLTGGAALVADSLTSGGSIQVRCGSLQVSSSTISAGTGSLAGGTVDLLATGAMSFDGGGASTQATAAGDSGAIMISAGSLSVLNSGFINADTFASGRAGNIAISVAGAMVVDGQQAMSATSVSSDSNSATSGAAGTITLHAGTLQLINGGRLDVSTFGTGAAGTISAVVDGSAMMSGFDGSGNAAGIFSQTNGAAPAGDAGNITLSAASLQVLGGAYIGALTFGGGNAGHISVTSPGLVVLDEMGASAFTGLTAQSATNATGNAGGITLQAGTLQLLNGGRISASTAGPGNAGTVTTNVGQTATFSGSDAAGNDSGIYCESTAAGPGGNAGSITLNAGALQLLDGGLLSASTFGLGAAGVVTTQITGVATISGVDAFGNDSAVLAVSDASGQGGSAGAINFTAGSLQLLDGGRLNATTFNSGAGGSINVIVGGSATFSGSDMNGVSSGILNESLTTGQGGNAGPITLSAGSLQLSGGAEISSSSIGQGTGGNISIATAGPLVLDGQGAANRFTVIRSEAAGGGDAGSISVHSGSLQVLNGAAITSLTIGPGAGGNVTVTVDGLALVAGAGPMEQSSIDADSQGSPMGGRAGSVSVTARDLQLLDGGVIGSNTFGSGAGGAVTIAVSGTLGIDSQGYTDATTGISALSNPGATGNAGNLSVAASNILVFNGGEIASATFGPGAGGKVTVNAAANLMLDARSFTRGITGISAQGNTGASGAGGDVVVSAGTLQIFNGAVISSSTSGAGTGGDVNVSVSGAATVAGGGGPGGGSAVVSESRSLGPGGKAGDVIFSAATLQLLDGGAISSSTAGQGAGGSVQVAVRGAATLMGSDPAGGPSGVFSESISTSQGGPAGNIHFTAGRLLLMNGAAISSSTDGAGAGGTANVSADQILIAGTGMPGISAVSRGRSTGGPGGSILVTARQLIVSGTGTLDTDTAGAGTAGGVMVRAQSLLMSGSATLESRSTGSGAAGTVDAAASVNAEILDGASISTSAPSSTGGEISLFAGGELRMRNATVTTQAGGNGGTIGLRAGDRVSLRHSRVISMAGVNGGNINIDPDSVVLRDSLVSANGGVNGGNVSIRPTVFFRDATTITATGLVGLSGQLLLTNPDPSLAGSLAPLSGQLVNFGAELQPQCAVRFGGDISSFIVTGRGGLPLEPGGLLPGLDPPGSPDHDDAHPSVAQ